eukprot:TRINITY_DN50451_c0_g1_i2.p1 TRINITY_DN50451_c0_g1~~TRINITY_DN50451_c0_g1_i2.p1  ORF type:complete len:206 (+),score=32.45 TRINITY_DN50451_c0_g1_i2:533-1150(+)
MPDPEAGEKELLEWQDFIISHPKQWRSYLKQITTMVRDGELPDLHPDADKTADGDFYCQQCDRHFIDIHGLVLHRQLHHDRRTVGQAYALGSGRCLICLKKFANRPKLKLHLQTGFKHRASGSCIGQAVLHALPRIPPEEVVRLNAIDRTLAADNKRKGRGADYADGIPLIKTSGPKREIIQGPLTDIERMETKHGAGGGTGEPR